MARGGTKSGSTRMEWYGQEVVNKINASLHARIMLATNLTRDRVVRNISRPGTKTDRSKPGEYPKLQTGNLQKSIFAETKQVAGGIEGYVGTPVSYGFILEERKNRKFLKDSLEEMQSTIKSIVTKKIT